MNTREEEATESIDERRMPLIFLVDMQYSADPLRFNQRERERWRPAVAIQWNVSPLSLSFLGTSLSSAAVSKTEEKEEELEMMRLLFARLSILIFFVRRLLFSFEQQNTTNHMEMIGNGCAWKLTEHFVRFLGICIGEKHWATSTRSTRISSGNCPLFLLSLRL